MPDYHLVLGNHFVLEPLFYSAYAALAYDNSPEGQDARLRHHRKINIILFHYCDTEEPLSLADAAKAIASLLSERPLLLQDWSVKLIVLWFSCFALARDTHYSDEAHIKLARLIAAVRRCSDASRVLDDWGESDNIACVSPLQGLSEMLVQSYNRELARDKARLPLDGLGEAWINSNALHANLYALHRSLLFELCLYTMNLAFPAAVEGTVIVAPDSDVSAAAMWIIYSGQRAFHEILLVPESEVLNNAQMPGRALQLRTDWERWHNGFDQAAEMADLRDDTRDLSRRVANLMHVFEGSVRGFYLDEFYYDVL